jgi:hypothetical protein
MYLRHCGFLLVLALCVATTSAVAQLRALKNWRDVEPGTITLLSSAKYEKTFAGNGKSCFSFRYGVRSEVPEITPHNYDLQYGNITWIGDNDWFIVTLATDDRSRIKDLGEWNWSGILNVPFLPAGIEPHKGFRGPSTTESFEQSSDGQVTKVVAGHMYVVHAKDPHTDLYALFRVENLVPGDEVTISWKLVPSPER